MEKYLFRLSIPNLTTFLYSFILIFNQLLLYSGFLVYTASLIISDKNKTNGNIRWILFDYKITVIYYSKTEMKWFYVKAASELYIILSCVFDQNCI